MSKMVTVILLLGALFSVELYARQGGSSSELKEFQSFWTEFRAAVKADDKEKIASLTAFPFKTRGTLDSDPVRKHTKASFLKILDKLLDDDPGLSPKEDKMRSFIERKAEIESKDLNGDRAQIGNFVFEKAQGKWAFTFAYLDN
jgi:hypothetical protein